MMVTMAATSSGPSGPGRRCLRRAAPTSPDLLRASARGDENAFAQLYDATSARIYGLVLRVVRDPAQSEEVAQEAFLDIWRHSARFDPAARQRESSWMLTIAHRKAVDRVRSARPPRRRDDTYGSRTPGRTFDETAETVERRAGRPARARRPASRSPTTQRSAVELAYLGGYTHTEVASLLDAAARHRQDPHTRRT